MQKGVGDHVGLQTKANSGAQVKLKCCYCLHAYGKGLYKDSKSKLALASKNCAYESETRLLKANFDQPLKPYPEGFDLIQFSVQHCSYSQLKVKLDSWQLLGNS